MERLSAFRSYWLVWLLLSPQLLLVGVFFFWPAGQALVQSFQQQDAFGASVTWVGLENFWALWRDTSYLASVQITFIFASLVTGSSLFCGLLLAIFTERVAFGSKFYQAVLLVPYAIAPVVSGVLWTFMFATPNGVISHWLATIGLNWNHLLSGRDAMILTVTAAAWKQTPYNFVFFLAGLHAIPKSLIEASEMDGAGPWRRFWTIQLPLLTPTAFFLLVINIVYS